MPWNFVNMTLLSVGNNDQIHRNGAKIVDFFLMVKFWSSSKFSSSVSIAKYLLTTYLINFWAWKTTIPLRFLCIKWSKIVITWYERTSSCSSRWIYHSDCGLNRSSIFSWSQNGSVFTNGTWIKNTLIRISLQISNSNASSFCLGKNFSMWQIRIELSVDIVKVDALAWQKNSKQHFLKDIENSFHQVTHIGLEPRQKFSL